MAVSKIVSLSTVQATLTNPEYGQIVMGGTGHMIGNISMERDNSAFSVSGSPDGGYVASFTKNKTGSVSVQIQQSSGLINRLTDFILWCEAHPDRAESEIVVTDELGNMMGSCTGVFPDKIPNNSISESVGSRTFTFNAGVVTFGVGEFE